MQSLPADLLRAVGVQLARQACPVYDARRDVAALNVALGLRGARRLEPGPAAELAGARCCSLREARALLACPCVPAAAAAAQLSRLPRVGRTGGASELAGADVRRLVHRAHGGDSARWLACCLARTRATVPPAWFADLWLPLHGCTLALHGGARPGDGPLERALDAIAAAWRDVLEAAECLGVEAGALRAPVGRWMREAREARGGDGGGGDGGGGDGGGGDGGGGGGSSAADWLVEQAGSAAARQRRAGRAVSAANLRAALARLGPGAFGPGAVLRAARLPRALWVPAALLDACVRHVVGGPDSGDAELADVQAALRRPETLAAATRELAAARGLQDHLDLLTELASDPTPASADQLDELQRTVAPFGPLGLAPHCCSTSEVEWVLDNVTGASSDDLPFHRSEQMPPLTDAPGLRACFDRRKRLVDALAERGLPLRDDSRICAAYVARGAYVGSPFPPHPHARGGSNDALLLVAEMMTEMHFLFQRTSYGAMLAALGGPASNSEVAKLAAIHEFTKLNNRPAAELPARLHAIAIALAPRNNNAIAAAWHNVQDRMNDDDDDDDDEDDEEDTDSDDDDGRSSLDDDDDDDW
jgi:hypothetical protein